MPYIANTPQETREMLAALDLKSMAELFADIPSTMAPASFDLPPGLDEMSTMRHFQELAAKNRDKLVSFLGGGYYEHYIPAAVDALSSRAEFYTAYTPYQPEAAQGTLQAIFEYQTALCRLFDMECANASIYDGGTALFEAVMMAVRVNKRSRIVVDEAVNPMWRLMLTTLTLNLGLETAVIPQQKGVSNQEALVKAVDDNTAAVVVQNPNFFGVMADYSALASHAKLHGALTIMAVNPVMQAVLKTPGEMGADITVAEGQPLGLPLAFGGPYLGMMASRKELVRQLPGRIVGKTKDRQGKDGYVLTLQAREQHIRRAKATSNICSNQALCALRSLVYLSLLGPTGLTRVAGLSLENAGAAAERLGRIKGVKLLNSAPFANEFAVELPVNAASIVDKLLANGYVPGLPLGRFYPGMENILLVASTEVHSPDHIATLGRLLEGALA